MRGILLFSLGVFCLSVMDAGAKWLTASYAVIQLIFFDSIFGTIPIAFQMRKEGLGVLRTPRWPWLCARGALTICTIFFFFSALKYLPLAEVTIIFLIAPLLTVLLSAIFLKERISTAQLIAIAAGLLGAILIIRPGTVSFELVMLLPVAAALSTALGLIASKVLVRTESSSSVVAYELLVMFCASALIVPYYWVTPTLPDWPVIALVGITGALGVYYRTAACNYSPLNAIAPLEYTGMVWAILFGFAIWGELPDLWGWMGAVLIAAGGIYVARQHSETT
ncbi:MAG: DMT family transporter [Pseudomonadota bacterium]